MTDLLEVLRRSLADRYAVDRELGRGGMAYVFLAHDVRHDRPVAIKVLRPELTAALGPERFLREIAVTARLSHPRIVAIYDSGVTDGCSYYVMPFITGESLRGRLEREKQLPVDDAIAITSDIAAALSYAHERGIVHRDIKPENILFLDGEAIVTDFGIGRAMAATGADRLTETGLAVGTPAYMSPEQAAADPHIDGRSDQFALACLLFEMLVGEPPFRGPTSQAIAARRATEAMPSICTVRAGVPPAVERTVRRALEKAPADRYSGTAAFADALAIAQRDPSATEQSAAVRRGTRRWIAPAVAVALMSVVAFVMTRHHEPRIAVLAVKDRSPNHVEEYVGIGLADELVGRLTATPGVEVAARASAAYFEDTRRLPSEIGAALKVDRLLMLTVAHAGSKLRIVAELVNARNGSRMHEYTFEVDSGGQVLGLAESIAPAVLRALNVRLAPATRADWGRHSSSVPKAVEAYQRGRWLFRTRRSVADLMRAAEHFRTAVTLDSTYASAWSGLSDTYSVLSAFGVFPPRDSVPRAKQFALRALQLDSTLAEARTSLGIISLLYDVDLRAAERLLRRALDADSDYAEAHLFLAYAELWSGHPEAGIAEARKALALDSTSVIINVRLGTLLMQAGPVHFAEAESRLGIALDLDPANRVAYSNLAELYMVEGRCVEALRAADSIPAGFPLLEAGIKGYTYARCGRREQARQLAASLEAAVDSGRFIFGTRIGMTYLGLGDLDRAFHWLSIGADQRPPIGGYASSDPLLAPLLADPRYKQLDARWRRSLSQ